jgi:uncharacterized tellurite resistance protein B-like protein
MAFLNLFRSLRPTKVTSTQQLMLGYANEGDVSALFTLLGLLAKSSGWVTAEEIRETQRFIDLHVPHSLHELAKDAFRKGKEANLVRGVITVNAFTLYWNRKERWLEPLQILDIMLKVALADGDFSSWEDYIIDCTRSTLGIHKRTYWILRDRLAEKRGIQIRRDGRSFAQAKGWSDLDAREGHRTESQAFEHDDTKGPSQEQGRDRAVRNNQCGTDLAYSILGLAPGASQNEIKKAYRLLVKKYHPDMLRNGQGASGEIEAAIAQFCKVQEAYEVLMN